MAVYQCAHFSTNPMQSHKQAVMRIGKYLLSSKNKGMIYSPDPSKGIEVYVHADFVGGWNPTQAQDADNVYLRTGFVIYYAKCPVYWQSKLQTEIALSTAEAEYIAMSAALREMIPMAALMHEMNECFPIYLPSPKFIIKVLKDNQSCIAMAENPKFNPRTKHIAINTITFGSMSSLKQIQMGSFSLSTVLQMIRMLIYLLNLSEMIFSTSSGGICWGCN
jgi:hypothetical protein